MCSNKRQRKFPSLIENSILPLSFMLKKRMDILIGRYASKYQLTGNALGMMMFFSYSGHKTAKEYVKHSGYSRSLISKTVDGLVKREFLIARPSEDDRRITNLTLTDKSHQILDEMENAMMDFEKRSLNGITEDEINCTISVLQKMLSNYQKLLEDNK